jgi:hypothetical protein
VSFNEDGDWEEFKDQMIMFPTAGVHDDLIDALAYIDQISVTSYASDYETEDTEFTDEYTGY